MVNYQTVDNLKNDYHFCLLEILIFNLLQKKNCFIHFVMYLFCFINFAIRIFSGEFKYGPVLFFVFLDFKSHCWGGGVVIQHILPQARWCFRFYTGWQKAVDYLMQKRVTRKFDHFYTASTAIEIQVMLIIGPVMKLCLHFFLLKKFNLIGASFDRGIILMFLKSHIFLN